MANNILFNGIKQVSKKWFDEHSGTTANIKNYLVLVRNMKDDGGNDETSIYFGSRKYADVGGGANVSNVVNQIAKELGGKYDESTGVYTTFLPISGTSVLSGETVTNVQKALVALDNAIKADSDELDELKRFIGEKPSDIGDKTLIQYLTDKIGAGGGGGGGTVDLKVEDVRVNNQSVVTNKVANITLPTATDLSSLTSRVGALEGKQSKDDNIHTFSGIDVED
nr:MAG TPA_asm: hypothetical protein [Caudoviricetes sp.]